MKIDQSVCEVICRFSLPFPMPFLGLVLAEVAANAMVVDVGSIVEDEASAKRLATLDFHEEPSLEDR